MPAGHREFMLCAWLSVGYPAVLFGFCVFKVRPGLQLACGLTLLSLSLAVVVASAAHCDAPFGLAERCRR